MTTSSSSAQIGRFGTISLLKRQDPTVSLTAFGIDMPELTFGRDPSCGVRLYYSEIAVVHCRIVFDDDRKAFLCVLGESGAMVDGCFVKGGDMVPLINGSEFEIRGKRFRFAYPPKEMRAALYASPIPPRTPRLSLITSTQVFSPRPSPDPRENLRILKSPLKNTFRTPKRGTTPLRTLFAQASSRYEYNSPMKPSASAPLPVDEDDDEKEEDCIILVDGNHPRVVEDEKDLVILEDIDRVIPPVHPSGSLYAHHQQQMFLHAPQPRTAEQEPPKTPARKRSQSLHRAVLIRSAQRAVLKAEKDEREREEEDLEEMEVLDVVAGLDGGNDNKKEEYEEKREHECEYEDVPMDVDMEEPLAGGSDDDDEPTKHEPKQKLTWRKSFERLWPFRSSSPTKDEENVSDSEDEEENENENEVPAPFPPPSPPTSPTDIDGDEEYESENEHPAPLAPPRTPLRPPHSRALGTFMTPQLRIGTSVSDPMIQCAHEQGQVGGGVGKGRFSLGGGEARRIVADSQVWRVRDIVVPPPESAVVDGVRGATIGMFASPVKSGASKSPRKVVVGEEERKAIQERRRSAMREPSGLGFVPGLSPMKPPSRVFSGGSGTSTSMNARSVSPSKVSTQPTLPAQPIDEKEDEAEDTKRLLERMKETVEGMKRRRSEVPQVSATPVRPPFTPGRGRSPVKNVGVFSLLRTLPRGDGVQKEVEDIEQEVQSLEKKENERARPPTPTPVREADASRTLPKGDVLQKELPSPEEKENGEAQLPTPTPVHQVDASSSDEVPIPMDEDGELACKKPHSRSKAKSPEPVSVPNEAGATSTESASEKPRSTSIARSPASICDQEAEVVSSECVQEKPRSKKSPAPVRVCTEPPREKTRSRSKAKSPVQDDNDHVAMGEQFEAEAELAPRITIQSEVSAQPEEKLRSRTPSRSKSTLRAPAPSRRTKVSPAPVSEPVGEMEETKPVEAPMKRGRKATTTTTPVTTSAQSMSVSNSEPAPTRRGRKPMAEPEDVPKRGRRLGVTTAAKAAEVPRRGVRRTPASAPAPVVDDEPVKRGRTLRAGLVTTSSKPRSKTPGMMETDGEGGRKGTVKGRKRAGIMKEEEDEGSVSGESADASTTIGPAKARGLAVSARTRKTPASAPAVPAQEMNKENENGNTEGVKMRVSRRGRGKKDVLAQEDDEVPGETEVKMEEGEEVAKGRSTRSTTRARAKT